MGLIGFAAFFGGNSQLQKCFRFSIKCLGKQFVAAGSMGLTVSADVFNVFNEGYVLERDLRLDTPTAYWVAETLSPRIWRLGVRLNWR